MPDERPVDEQDTQEILQAEAEGMTHADMGLPPEEEVAPAAMEPPTPPPAAPEGEFLEETILPSTVENHELRPGSTHTWGSLTFTAGSAYLGGWITASQRETRLLVKPRQEGSLLAGLGNHRLLPRLVYTGPEGVALEASEGDPIGQPLSLSQALEVVQPLAQLVYFLELKGLALVDLEPRALLRTPQGLGLLPPPRLARLGERAGLIWREGYTPPEILAEAAVNAKTGVYLLGALLFELLSGTALPAEGPSPLLLSGIPLAGVPQVLNQLLASVKERPTPQQAIALLKGLSRSPDPVLELGAATSVGLNPTRPVNEDSYSYRIERFQSHGNPTLWLRACVSDGMGGMAAGEVASQAAVEAFVAGSPPHPLDDPKAQADWAIRLVWDSNQAALDALAGRDGGCTLTGVLLVGTRYALAHVGDCRAYRWIRGSLEQLSQDHSLVASLVASGMITPEEAQHHPDRNQVLRSLGNLRQPQPDYVISLETTLGTPAAHLEAGETLLLVSDGVWGEVSDPQIAAILTRTSSPQAAAEALVQAALDAGAPDNATALVIVRRA
jgi:protein phosphatase